MHLELEIHVLHELVAELLELLSLLGRHGVEHLLGLRHPLGHDLEQLVEGLRVLREEIPVALHESVEVGLLTVGPLLEHPVELRHHVLQALHVLGGHVVDAFGDLIELLLHQLLAKLLHQLLELLAGLLALEVVVLQALHLAGEVGREHVELHVLHRCRVGFELLLTLIDAIALGLVRLTQLIERRPFRLDDLAQRIGDVVVDAAEIVVLEDLATALPEALHHVADALHVATVAIGQAVLHHLPQRRVDVAVIEQLVRHLTEEMVGVEIEPGLAAIPARVGEVRRLPPTAVTTTREDHGRNVVRSPDLVQVGAPPHSISRCVAVNVR